MIPPVHLEEGPKQGIPFHTLPTTVTLRYSRSGNQNSAANLLPSVTALNLIPLPLH